MSTIAQAAAFYDAERVRLGETGEVNEFYSRYLSGLRAMVEHLKKQPANDYHPDAPAWNEIMGATPPQESDPDRYEYAVKLYSTSRTTEIVCGIGEDARAWALKLMKDKPNPSIWEGQRLVRRLPATEWQEENA